VRGAFVAPAIALAVALVAAGCGSGVHPGASPSTSATTSTTGSTTSSAPVATGSGPGITAGTITIGNVSTVGGLVPGLFEGARYGVEAYADYVNSTGGVDGRKLVVDTGDDQLSCTTNTAQSLSLLPDVAAFVGNFSLFDYCGAQAIPTTVPYIGVSTDVPLNNRPNFYSPNPIQDGWATGSLLYFKQHYPQAVLHVGALVAGVAPAPASWAAEEKAMQSLGYHISVVDQYFPLTTQFTSDVIGMQQAGVQMVVLDPTDVATDARFVDAMVAQGFKPALVTSAGTAYDATFIQQAGVQAASMITSAQHQVLYDGQDSSIPAVAVFDHWYQVAWPGHEPDVYALYAWASAELFVQAVRSAGSVLSRASILAALARITSFDADGLMAPADPAARQPSTCFIIARVINGNWQRVDTPPNGWICTGSFFKASGN
jgi:branched-chain amino acid transport system substrate-binding protein